MARGKVNVLLPLLVWACGDVGDGAKRAPSLHLEELQRYGSVDDHGSALTDVAAVLPSDSAVLILESDQPRVAVFSFDGTWQRDVGRAGDGPGEFRGPSYLAQVDGDLWVGDPRGARLERFGPDLNPMASYRWDIPPDTLGSWAFPTFPLADGSIVAGPGALSMGAATSGRTRHRSYFRTTADGHVLGELYRETLESADFFSAEVGPSRSIVGMHPLRESPMVAFFPDGSGLVVVERPEADSPADAVYRIRVLGVDPGEQQVWAVPYSPVPTDGWLEAYLAEVEDDMIARSGSVDRGVLAGLGGSLSDRRYYPPVTVSSSV